MNDQADLVLLEVEDHMSKTVSVLVKEFATVRTGRANPSLLDRISIDYYSVDTPLKQISSVSVVEGNQLFIKPFDKSTLKKIEQAIHASDLGLNPINDGVGIRLILPSLTEQRRRELVKNIEKMGEHSKVGLRNVRRDGNDQIKKLGLSEDDEKGYLEDVQEVTNLFVKKIDEEVEIKAAELLQL